MLIRNRLLLFRLAISHSSLTNLTRRRLVGFALPAFLLTMVITGNKMSKYHSLCWLVSGAMALSACQQPAYEQALDSHQYSEYHFVMNVPVYAQTGAVLGFTPIPADKPQFTAAGEMDNNMPSSAEVALATVPAGDDDIADMGKSLDGLELDDIRGAFTPSQANLNLLSGNSAYNKIFGNSVTGVNVINEGSFEGTSGLVNIIQNSGNNALIQSATIINLNLNSTAATP